MSSEAVCLHTDLPPAREEEEEAPGPARKVLVRRISAVEDPEDLVAAEIARLSDVRRGELVAQELRRQDMQKFSGLLRAAVERLQGGDRDGAEAGGVYYPRATARGSKIWSHTRGFYLLRSAPDEALWKVGRPLAARRHCRAAHRPTLWSVCRRYVRSLYQSADHTAAL